LLSGGGEEKTVGKDRQFISSRREEGKAFRRGGGREVTASACIEKGHSKKKQCFLREETPASISEGKSMWGFNSRISALTGRRRRGLAPEEERRAAIRRVVASRAPGKKRRSNSARRKSRGGRLPLE